MRDVILMHETRAPARGRMIVLWGSMRDNSTHEEKEIDSRG